MILLFVYQTEIGLRICIGNVLERLVLKNAALVSVSSRLLELDLRAPSMARSLDRSIARSLNRSIAQSLARALDASIARSLDRSTARSLARALDGSIARLLDRSIAQSLHRTFSRSVCRSRARLAARSRDRLLFTRSLDGSIARFSLARSIDCSIACPISL